MTYDGVNPEKRQWEYFKGSVLPDGMLGRSSSPDVVVRRPTHRMILPSIKTDPQSTPGQILALQFAVHEAEVRASAPGCVSCSQSPDSWGFKSLTIYCGTWSQLDVLRRGGALDDPFDDRYCGRASTPTDEQPGWAITVWPDAFTLNCPCLGATILHEVAHMHGYGHSGSSSAFELEKKCFGPPCTMR